MAVLKDMVPELIPITSRDVCRQLDRLGFSRIQIWNRIREMNIRSKVRDLSIKSSIKTNNERILIGSQREGLGLSVLSDIDVLQVDHDVICTKDTSSIDDNRGVLKIIDTNTPPGYCLLQVDQSAVDSVVLDRYRYAFDERCGNTYLSSKVFVANNEDDMLKVNKFAKNNSIFQPQHGPSTPRYVTYSQFESCLWHTERPASIKINEQSDFVRAFPCDGYAALDAWQTRIRPYNWPSKRTIRHIMTLPIYVVPVGQKETLFEDLEWRISFVQAEIKLVQSFNNVQMKMFLLLKLIAKRCLKSESKVVSSYVMKNIMFWLAEEIPQKKFRRKHLMSRIKDALEKLEDSLVTKKLRSYMLPEKNLFENRLDDTVRQWLIRKIRSVMGHRLEIFCAYLFNGVIGIMGRIVDELQICNRMTQNEIYTFIECDTKMRLHFTMFGHKLKSENELIVASAVFLRMRPAINSNMSVENDKYCSSKLIQTEKELRAINAKEMKPGLWIRFDDINEFFNIHKTSKYLLYINTKNHNIDIILTQTATIVDQLQACYHAELVNLLYEQKFLQNVPLSIQGFGQSKIGEISSLLQIFNYVEKSFKDFIVNIHKRGWNTDVCLLGADEWRLDDQSISTGLKTL
ncbi:hypothetical protein ACF0H5_016975 [Mactra antiquata]